MAGFEAWCGDYIARGKSKYGAGVCWDYMETGICSGMCLGYSHPQLEMSEGEDGVVAKMAKYNKFWVDSLRAVGFRYDRADNSNVNSDLTIKEAVDELLQQGVRMEHFRFTGGAQHMEVAQRQQLAQQVVWDEQQGYYDGEDESDEYPEGEVEPPTDEEDGEESEAEEGEEESEGEEAGSDDEQPTPQLEHAGRRVRQKRE